MFEEKKKKVFENDIYIGVCLILLLAEGEF